MEYENYDFDYYDEVQREIVEECMEYEENMARSEEHGWFYAEEVWE